jgi:hypothetical protein
MANLRIIPARFSQNASRCFGGVALKKKIVDKQV